MYTLKKNCFRKLIYVQSKCSLRVPPYTSWSPTTLTSFLKRYQCMQCPRLTGRRQQAGNDSEDKQARKPPMKSLISLLLKVNQSRLRAPIALVYFSTSATMAADSAAGSGRLVSMEILQTVVLQLVVICSVFALTYVEGASLPSGVCYWRQGSLINGVATGATEDIQHCRFEVRDPEFLDLLGSSPKLVEWVTTDAHEGAVWYPDANELYFSSNRIPLPDGSSRADLKKVNLKTGAVTVLSAPKTDVPNGMALDNNGNLLVTQQGDETEGGFIQRVYLKTGNTTVVADNWFGVPFNSPNDVVVQRDGSIWLTDPSYGRVQGFRSAPEVNNQVYRISPSGVVDAVADGFSQPNGLAFSHDEKRLYVTDTGFAVGQGSYNILRPHSIIAFDVGADGFLSNRRLFASVGVYDGSAPGLGIPDGIKVDTKDRVYTATVDGIQVFAKSGKPLGLIRQPGASNMGFAGKGLDTLYILNGTIISYVKLKVKGAGLKYASMS